MQDIEEVIQEDKQAERIEKLEIKTQNSRDVWWLCSSCACGLCIIKNIRNMVRAEIKGQKGEVYEVGFNYIKVVCRKCGKENYTQSGIPEIFKVGVLGSLGSSGIDPATGDIEQEQSFMEELADELDKPIKKNFFELSQPKRKILLKKLSERQKAEYKLILENLPETENGISKNYLIEISKKEGLPIEIIRRNMQKIINEVGALKS